MCLFRCCCVRLLAIVPALLCTITTRASLAVCLAAACLATLGPRGLAADGSWNTNNAGTWSTSSNWLGSVIPGSTTATNSADIATFGFTLTAGRTVTVDANRNIGGITFSNTSAFGYTLQTGNLLLSNGGTIQTATAAGAHTDTISSAIAIQGNGGSATFTAGGTNAANRLSIGAVTGVSTAGSTTTLTLNGINTGSTNAITGTIADGTGGGQLADGRTRLQSSGKPRLADDRRRPVGPRPVRLPPDERAFARGQRGVGVDHPSVHGNRQQLVVRAGQPGIRRPPDRDGSRLRADVSRRSPGDRVLSVPSLWPCRTGR